MKSRVRSTLRRVGVHVVNSLSDLVGDDVLGRRVRHALLRLAGARLAPRATVHGGTHFSNPANLSIGNGSLVNRDCYFDLEAPITLHDDVGIGHGTTIITTTHAIGPPQRRAGDATAHAVTVHSGAWIAARCVLMPGVTVGAGAIVATGAIVTRDVPANVVFAGSPARMVRKLSTEDDPRDLEAEFRT